MPFLMRHQRGLLGFLLVVATAALTVGAWVTPYFGWDLSLSHSIQSLGSPFLEGVARSLHQAGRPVTAAAEVVALGGVFFLAGRRRPAALVWATLIPNILNQGLKAVIERPRPDASLVHVLVESGSSTFPSGHLVYFTLLFGVLLYLAAGSSFPKGIKVAVALLLVAGVVLVGLSRVYLGAHWASDVLGGFLWGVLYLGAVLYAYRRWWRPA